MCKQHPRLCSSTCAVLLTLSTILWSIPASAAGFFLPTRGVEASGRGGANVAPHRADLNSIWYNPAGLALIDDLQLTVDAALVGVSDTHLRAPRQMDDGSTRTYETVQNQSPPNVIPQIVIGGSTPHPDIGWAVGGYTHYAGTARYPQDGPQRYVLIDNVGSAMGYLHGAVGWQVTERLALGAGIQNFMGELRIVATGSGYTGMFGDPEDEDLDVMAIATMRDFVGLTGNLGVTFRIHDRLQSGLSLQLPHSIRDSQATLETRMPDHPAYDNAQTSNDRVALEVPYPFYLRGGLRYVSPSFDAELAVVYQHWSVVDQFVADPDEVEVTGVPGVDSMPVSPIVVPQEFRNTVSVHLGGEYRLATAVDLRAGYVFERGAVPDHRYSVMALDPDKHQLSAGGSYHFGTDRQRVSIDLTTAYIAMPSKEITNSEVRQVNPSSPDGEHSLVVGNGTYEHRGFIVGLGVRSRF